MAISRQQLAKELEPGLNALFGLEYKNYENQHTEIFDTETSDRAFEEEVMLSGFGTAAVKAEGAAVVYDTRKRLSLHDTLTRQLLSLFLLLKKQLKITCMIDLAHVIRKH